MKRKLLHIALMLTCLCSVSALQAQLIYTYAGRAGMAGYSGNDSIATLARINGPSAIAVSATGNVFFADTRNNVIREVNAARIITTFAGTGTGGYLGDGGPASAAQLRGPAGIAIDRRGNVIIADTRNNVIRKVDTLGVITTIAGNGTAGYTGDGGPATAAQFREPYGLAVDTAGNVYVGDTRNYVVRKISTAGIITTYAGNGIAGYSGDLGPATAAQLNGALGMGMAMTAAGVLYIADTRNHVIRRISAAGIISTFAGNGAPGRSGDGGPASAAMLFAPNDVKLDAAGNVFVSDSSNTVRVINTGDTIRTYAGTGTGGYSGDGGPATAADMIVPSGLAIDAAHNVYISTPATSVIRRVGAAVPSITITSNMGDTACIGSLAYFTATAIGDTATAHYQWLRNGVAAGTDTSYYVPTSWVTGDAISCMLLTIHAGTVIAISNTIRVDSVPRAGVVNGPNTFCVGSNGTERIVGGAAGGGVWASSDSLVASVNPAGLVTGLTIGIDTIFHIMRNVCGADTAMLPVTVTANTISHIIGPDSVCTGSTVTYSDTTGVGMWTSRPGNLGHIDSLTGVMTFGNIPGPGLIVYGTSRTCYIIDTVIVTPAPHNAPITGIDSVYTHMMDTLASMAPFGVWTSSDTTIATVNAATGVVTGIAAGTVTITYTITSPGGCANDTTFTLNVIASVGVRNIQGNHSFDIFPNPVTNGTLTITWTNVSTGNAAISISDVTGRLVTTQTLHFTNASGSEQVDVSLLKAGVYFVAIETNGQQYVTKLVIE